MDFLTIKKTPEEVSKVIRNSCYDCHSNETKYPWYSNIAPVSWWMKIILLMAENILIFLPLQLMTQRQLRKLDESVEMIEKDKMPLETYLLVHQNARLSDMDKNTD